MRDPATNKLLSRSQPGLRTPVDIRWKKAQEFSLFGPPGVTFQRRTSISKSFHAKKIGPDS
jgi:hypothetical protein